MNSSMAYSVYSMSKNGPQHGGGDEPQHGVECKQHGIDWTTTCGVDEPKHGSGCTQHCIDMAHFRLYR